MGKRIVLALDPSGAFFEGKGTTGWCMMSASNRVVLRKGALYAIEHQTDMDYWNAHIRLIAQVEKEYPLGVAVVIEDYLLYAGKANEQINSRFETSQLIGVLKFYCWQQGIPVYIQTAAEVKRRWADPVLLGKGILRKEGRSLVIPNTTMKFNNHELDALRHAIHFSTFYNN